MSRRQRWPEAARSRWSAEVLFDRGLSEAGLRVAFCLAPLLGQGGQVRPVETAIASRLGLSVEDVHRALAELVSREHLRIVHAEQSDDRQYLAVTS